MNTEKVYIGKRYGVKRDIADECAVFIKNGSFRPLNHFYELVLHSPDGFNWGFIGSSSAQLSFAILADCLGPNKVEKCPICGYDFSKETIDFKCFKCGQGLGIHYFFRVFNLYQIFMQKVISKIPAYEDWELNERDIIKIVKEIEENLKK